MRGRIIKGIAGFYYVHTGGAGIYECKAKGIFRKENIKPLVGDEVAVEIIDEQEKEGNIIQIFPRKNELNRPAASNVDQALVVFAAAKPDPLLSLLNRFLVMMEVRRIPSILCFNKMDLVSGQQLAALRQAFTGCAYPLVFTSALEPETIEPLRRLLRGKTTVMAGPSGVGKSSLLNLLAPQAGAQTGAVSRKTERGRHTTRHCELFPLEEGTYMMDTPGFSSFYAEGFDKEGLKCCFPEFAPYEGTCRFVGCSHIHEPGCKVKQAVEDGQVSRERYKSYTEIYEELGKKRRH